MQITKRNGDLEPVKFEKISKRLSRQAKDLKNVDLAAIGQKIIAGLYDGVSSIELDALASETAYSYSTKHTEYNTLATRLAISSLHKQTSSSFSETMFALSNIKDENGNNKGLVDEKVLKFIKKNAHLLDSRIDYSRDFLFDYFGFKTLERSYLLKIDGKIVERPQHLWMRCAIGIHFADNDIDKALNTYDMLSSLSATHATPTLYNSSRKNNQLSSCFLMGVEDSIDGIYDCLKKCALISQSAGGIAVHFSNVRSKGSYIYGSSGISSGIIPMLKVFCETARYVNQGSKRPGAVACYLEPWHADILDFLDLRKNNGKEEMRARDLNLAVWASDHFFKCVKEDLDWYLMDPNVSKGLSNVYDDIEDKQFTKLYEKYVADGKYVRKLPAREIWAAILTSMIETGQPYLLNKDSGNRKSNQKNIGIIKSSNLCCEIFEVSDSEETAVCNLASINLASCVEKKDKKVSFNFTKLEEITKTLTENLNKIIDVEFYPIPSAKKSNIKNRPIGIGIQGLSDTFLLHRYSWEDKEAKQLNIDIAETIYYSFLKTSMELAKEKGAYETFKGSPAEQGILQFDMWNVKPSDRYNWNELREDIKKFGLRNSLGIAPMPTASTSQILGSSVECFEPITSNIYKRTTLSGDFIQVNKHLINDLIELGIWNDNIKQKIIANDGSVQNIEEIPSDIKRLYKTVWELSQKILIDMSADRGAYICQSQSLNLYFKEATFAALSSALMYGNEKGLKTISYYIRSQGARSATKITVDKNIESQVEMSKTEELVCSLDNRENCDACGS